MIWSLNEEALGTLAQAAPTTMVFAQGDSNQIKSEQRRKQSMVLQPPHSLQATPPPSLGTGIKSSIAAVHPVPKRRPARSSLLSYQCQAACHPSSQPHFPVAGAHSPMRLPRSARMTPCNRFKTRQPKGKQIPPQARPSQARPYPCYTAEPPAFGPTPSPFANALITASCLSPSRQVLKKVRYRVEEKIFVFKPHVSCSDVRSPQAVKAIRRDRGEVAAEDVIMLRKKGFVGSLFREPRSSISSSHGSSSYTTNGKRDEEKKKRK